MPVLLNEGKDRIIVALDTQKVPEVSRLVQLLAPHVGMFKAGFELTNAVGTARALRAIKVNGGKDFADVKFHDIPPTVGKAVQAVAGFGPHFLNMHIQSGDAAMQGAVAQKGISLLLGVSILTSLDPQEVLEMFVGPFIAMTGHDYEYGQAMATDSEDAELAEHARELRTEYMNRLVLGFAEKAARNGLDGLICSPLELRYLKEHGTEAVRNLIKVVPGIRMADSSADDQQRVGTPYQTIIDGADYLVVGRPILTAADPVAAAQAIAAEIDRALDDMD